MWCIFPGPGQGKQQQDRSHLGRAAPDHGQTDGLTMCLQAQDRPAPCKALPPLGLPA